MWSAIFSTSLIPDKLLEWFFCVLNLAGQGERRIVDVRGTTVGKEIAGVAGFFVQGGPLMDWPHARNGNHDE